jgi:hypothetical protein
MVSIPRHLPSMGRDHASSRTPRGSIRRDARRDVAGQIQPGRTRSEAAASVMPSDPPPVHQLIEASPREMLRVQVSLS